MHKLKQLHWPLIISLGALALIRPFLSVSGLMDQLGRPAGPLLVTALISLIWLAVIVLARVREPILTLVCSGLVYGACAIALSAILSPLLRGELSGPITNPFVIVAVLITNAIWGAIVGVVALGLQQMLYANQQGEL